jgi:tetratricopeptide (TPR) repeat protein
VFAGGWTLEAAESVGVGVDVATDDVLDLLDRLVRKSLVVASEAADGTERFALLESVRDYARQKLLARGPAETTAARERHAVFFSNLAQRLYVGPWVGRFRVAEGWSVGDVLDRVEVVYENLRNALGWWFEARQATHGLRVALTLCEFWIWSGMYAEARRWLERMLELANDTTATPGAAEGSVPDVPVELRAHALILVGTLTSWQGDHVRSCALLDEGATLVGQLEDSVLLARTFNVLGLSLWLAGAAERSATVLHESLRIGLELGNPGVMAAARRQLGIVARWQAQYERANVQLRESLAQAHRLASNRGFQVARGLSNLGRVVYFQRDYPQARTLLCQAIEVIREFRLRGWPLADGLDWLGAIAAAQGDAVFAAHLFGAAEVQWQASGAVRYTPDQADYERDLASVHALLDDSAFAAAWSEGFAMGADQAIAYALEETSPEFRETDTSAENQQALG